MEMSSTMKRLFVDSDNSPAPRDFLSSASLWSEAELESIMTPYGKSKTTPFRRPSSSKTKSNRFSLIDEDSGLGMETDATEDCFQLSTVTSLHEENTFSCFNGSFNKSRSFASPFLRPHRSSAKKKLFTNKRGVELSDAEDDMSPSFKKFRNSESSLLKFALTNSPIRSPDSSLQSIIQAVDRLSTEEDLVADGSRTYSLPTILGKHGDLKTINCDTMAHVVSKEETSKDIIIVDCRYPYEYQGGHIKGAINLYTKDEIFKLLQLPVTQRPRVIVFHCEFSSERGPKMYRFLRSSDRDLNKDDYPNLHYPEMYLLEGGYKVFYENHKSLCDPNGYKPMLHKDHSSDLRHFRVKSKSWAGGQKGNKPSKSRLTRSCLSFKY